MELFNAGSRMMNTYLYQGPQGWVMVDTGYEETLSAVTSRLARHNLTLSDLRCVFLTHARNDSAGFLRPLLNSYPRLTCVAAAQAADLLDTGRNQALGCCASPLSMRLCRWVMGQPDSRFPAIGPEYREHFLYVTPDNTAEAEALLGGRILFTPGHSADSISLLVEDRLFCGSAAMNGFPSHNHISVCMEDQEAYAASWDVLLASGAETLCPAHGRPFPAAELTRFREEIGRITLRRD